MYFCRHCFSPEGKPHASTCPRSTNRQEALDRARAEGRRDVLRQGDKPCPHCGGSHFIEDCAFATGGDKAEPTRPTAFDFWCQQRDQLKQVQAAYRKGLEDNEATIRRIEDLLPLLADMHE